MAAPELRRPRWGAVLGATWFKVAAGVTATAALVAGALLSGGYQVAQTKVDDGSVWALQSGQGERYARVDTALGQLDTVKAVNSPSDLVQGGGHVLLYTQSDAKVASVDLAQPVAYTDGAAGFSNTPDGTQTVVNTGDYIGYLSSTGAVHASRIEDAGKNSAAIPAPGSKGDRSFSADVITIGTDGILYAYSHTLREVLRFDVQTGRTLGTDAVPSGPNRPGATMTVVGDTWVLLSKSGGSMWIRGVPGAVRTGIPSAVLQQPSGAQSVVAVAGAGRLAAFRVSDGGRTVLATAHAGTPAAPAWQGDHLYAAWVPQGSTPGQLWSGRVALGGVPRGSMRTLDYGGSGAKDDHTLAQTAMPVFRGNGSAEILNDINSGWVWSVPSGTLVQGSQNWSLDENNQTQQNETTTQTQAVTNPEPPVAVNDSFGVRAGALESLPVLLNDYDPNGDVISIVPNSVTGLSPGFGTASVADGDQNITVQLAPGASGTATFQYVDTDGTGADGGLRSSPATVTLTVIPSSQNSAPVWCNGDTHCLYSWPDGVSVAPGGSVEVPVLRGWVDPDGDPIFAEASSDSAAYTVSVSPEGTLVFQASPAAHAGIVAVPVTVSDINGATTQKVLHVDITPSPTLQVESFGLMTAVGVPLTVDPSTHIRGAKGTPQISSATLSSSNSAQATSAATVTVDSSGETFAFEASQPGSYPVTMTVTDPGTKSAATATVRITVVGTDQSLLSTSPVTIFVRPQTDTSVDVFSAVQNPTGRVLLLSDPQPKPAPGASLDVDVVGQSQLRVRGTTGSGQQGLLGTVNYTVNDGTSNPAMQVQGTATVYLLPDTPPSRPVAINDSATVRAGAQIDIPVLANDVAPDGDVVELDPSSVQNPAHQGLAFASGQVLRYLAPSTAPSGPVTLRYSAYSAGDPSAESQATVTITVLPQGGDRPPQPVTLTGRVVAGASVRIPFDPYGIDPDGDMVSLDRIMTQPQSGTAQISADGTAIVFTALANSAGQETFTYRVRDSEGETGTASVMIGVLNAQTDPAPVTFSDYVQVQAGAGNQVVVQPTSNDIDPSGGSLTLTGVTPDAPKSSALYSLLAQHIASQNSTQLVITSTPNPRTLTYTYSVKNQQGDVSAGLIVVDVVSGHVPDYPVAVDTVVDAQSRSQLAAGIDVVHGKVSWGSGDVSGLTLAPYEKQAGVSFDGDLIKVSSVPDSGLLVPFKLSGRDFTGQVETSYGFLRVPALSDVILALKSGVNPMQVHEGSSASVDLNSIVGVPPHSVLTAQNGSVKTTGARKGASCSIEGTTLTYTAGDGAPWTDACLAPVRLIGQQEYTTIPVPVQVIPKQPEPQLRPASLTASPGLGAVGFDLTQMTTWLGHSDLSGLQYQVSYHGSLFTVSQSGRLISVRAADTAQPGLEEVAQVSLVGYSGVGTTADITLKVGPAPSTKPAGGSTSLSCSEAQGTSCETTVVGLPDEVNAYSTPLKVVSVPSQVTGCTGVTFSAADGRTIAATWAQGAPGGNCTVPFVVQDAQGKRSDAGGGDGKLSFQLKGYPPAPAAVAQLAYTGTSVTLAVTPGNATSAFPAITGFHIYMDGHASVTCDVQGVCPPITGLKNGQQHSFVARSVNSVGESLSGVSTTGWAFAEPVVSGVTAKPVYDPSITSTTTGAFDVTIPNTDSSASGYRIDWAGSSQTVQAGGGGSVTVRLAAAAGTPTVVTVTPLSQYPQPPGDKIGAQPASVTVTPAGSPSLSANGISFTTTSNSVTVDGTVSGNPNGSQIVPAQPYLFIAWQGSGAPSCSNSGDQNLNTNASLYSSSRTISNLTQFNSYEIFACYTNAYGASQPTDLGSATAWSQPGSPTGWTFTVSDNSGGAALPDYEFQGSQPSGGSVPDGYVAEFADPTQGYSTSYSYPNTWGQDPQISVRYCGNGFLSLCTAPGSVTPSSSSAPYQLRVTQVTQSCTVDAGSGAETGTVSLQGQGIDSGVSVGITSYSYVDSSGGKHVADGNGQSSVTLPAGASKLRVLGFQITLPAGFATPRAGTDRQLTVDPSCTG